MLKVFLPYVEGCFTKAARINEVWDAYRENSLKAAARSNRGSRAKRQVAAKVAVLQNWPNFLRVDDNKKALFKYQTSVLIEAQCVRRKIYVTDGQSVSFVPPRENTLALAPCSHEEADTRLLLHSTDAVQSGHRKIVIRTVDSDVVILATAMFTYLPDVEELWITFGAGKSYRYISIHSYAEMLRIRRANVGIPYLY